MDPIDRRHQETELELLFPNLIGFDQAKTVLLYVSHLPEEFETRRMIDAAADQGKRVACPRVDRLARQLRLFKVEDPDRELVSGPFGIPEPGPSAEEIPADQIDWALIPGIAFDTRGYRLGRGAGYYDRLLPTLPSQAVRLSLALSPQWIDSLPVESHDEAVDAVIGVDRSWVSPTFRERRGW